MQFLRFIGIDIEKMPLASPLQLLIRTWDGRTRNFQVQPEYICIHEYMIGPRRRAQKMVLSISFTTNKKCERELSVLPDRLLLDSPCFRP